MSRIGTPSHDPEQIAIAALGWIAGDQQMLKRFLDLTGIEASDIRHAASEPAFLAGVLQFILAHEPTLTAFALEMDFHPSNVASALKSLPGGSGQFDQGSI
ncbi:MAG: DUF3572 domain-containing protein [Rhizobiaceae bacterium]